MSEPTWAQPARPFVPSHLQPGSTRSSFAKPDTYNLVQHAPAASGAGAHGHANTQSASKHRTGFNSRQRTRSKRATASEGMPDDELPPTLSIRSVPNQDLDFESESSGSTSFRKAATKPKPAASTGYKVRVFGFPPGTANEVLQFFGNLGEIIDNSLPHDAAHADRSNSVECGRNWLCITYNDLQSAQAAIGQDGRIMPGQYEIGCKLVNAGDSNNGLMQSSTNSMLLDDTELSFVQEQSLDLSASAGDKTGDKTGADSKSPRPHHADAAEDAPASSIGKIVPVELSNVFRTPAAKKEVPRVTDFTSTSAPASAVQNSGTVGRIVGKVTDFVFGWDV